MFCKFRAVTTDCLLMSNEIFDGNSENLLPTKSAPIALLNLSIIHDWFLGINRAWEQIRMYRIESCAKQQI